MNLKMIKKSVFPPPAYFSEYYIKSDTFENPNYSSLFGGGLWFGFFGYLTINKNDR